MESGNLQVYLRPRIDGDGSLWLDSPPGGFGEDGAYILVRFGRRHFAARVPLHESFHLYLDGEGVLRTDHVRLHYKLVRS